MNGAFAERQWEALRAHLRGVCGSSPFYAAKIPAGVVGNIGSREDFCAAVPCTTKQELLADQQAHPPEGSTGGAPRPKYLRFCQTSGTTGRALRVWDTEESWAWLLGNWDLGYQWAGVEPGMTAYFAFSFGPFLGFWTAFEAAVRRGVRVIPGGGLGTRARVYALWEHRAEVLCCTPTYALQLAEVARREGMAASASPVRKILVAGEPGGSIPEVRRRLERDWPGAEVLDHYGLTETGPVAFAVSGNTDRSGLRVLGDRYFAEVLVPGGVEPVREGEPGELVLTPLGRSDWPLIRYRTGDLVRARCDESGQLWLEEGILGRVDDMQVVRGVNVYPSAVDALVRSLEGVGEYRVVLSTRGALTEMRLEVEGEAAVAGELESLFEQRLCLRIPVQAVGAGTLPQFEMKARRWVREGIFPG